MDRIRFVCRQMTHVGGDQDHRREMGVLDVEFKKKVPIFAFPLSIEKRAVGLH